MEYNDIVSKSFFSKEIKKIKKKEQELYKFILDQFLELEEFKKKFAAKIKSDVDKKVELIENMINEFNENKNDNPISENIDILKSETKNILETSLLEFKNQFENNIKETSLVHFKNELEETLRKDLKEYIDEVSIKINENVNQSVDNTTEENVSNENIQTDEVNNVNEKEENQVIEAEGNEVEVQAEGDEVEEAEGEVDDEEEQAKASNSGKRVTLTLTNTTYFSKLDNQEELKVANDVVVFLKNNGSNRKFYLPEPTGLEGMSFLIINTNNSPWVITAENNVKINNQYEKNLIRANHFLKLITDGEKYYII